MALASKMNYRRSWTQFATAQGLAGRLEDTQPNEIRGIAKGDTIPAVQTSRPPQFQKKKSEHPHWEGRGWTNANAKGRDGFGGIAHHPPERFISNVIPPRPPVHHIEDLSLSKACSKNKVHCKYSAMTSYKFRTLSGTQRDCHLQWKFPINRI